MVGLAIAIILIVLGIILVSYNKLNFKRKLKREIPITYNIGWWSNQKILTIEKFTVDIIESKLNLFNNKTLISYTITGQLKYDHYWKPYIKEVHLSERVLITDIAQDIDAVIEITPVVAVKNDKSKKDGEISFGFKNEHIINSMHWRTNKIKLICGTHEKTIKVYQLK